MRVRTVLATALVTALAASSFAPALAAPAKKPVKLAYTASALPDPSSTNPVTGEICAPTTPTGIHHFSFKVPGPGTLKVSLNNTLDWSVAVRDARGRTLADADAASPEVAETVTLKLKKAQTVSIDTCNFAGEPSIDVTGTFTPSK